MKTDCKQSGLKFHRVNQREVMDRFDGGAITSDGGGLLLREVEKRTVIVERLASCFRDYRVGERVEHTVKELVAQRVYALALGYEALNDHEEGKSVASLLAPNCLLLSCLAPQPSIIHRSPLDR